MKTSALRTLVLAASAALSLTMSWAATPAAYVPRSDYEQLKTELDQLRARFDALATAPAAATTTASAPRAAGTRLGLDLSNFKPGWQRFRSSDWTWMDHDRIDEMNARIASPR